MGLDAQIRALRQPVRPLVVVKYLARLSLIAGLLGLVPLAVCLGLAEWALAGRWGLVILALAYPCCRAIPCWRRACPGSTPCSSRSPR